MLRADCAKPSLLHYSFLFHLRGFCCSIESCGNKLLQEMDGHGATQIVAEWLLQTFESDPCGRVTRSTRVHLTPPIHWLWIQAAICHLALKSIVHFLQEEILITCYVHRFFRLLLRTCISKYKGNDALTANGELFTVWSGVTPRRPRYQYPAVTSRRAHARKRRD